MTPEQIYKANISTSHEAALDAVFNAGVTVGMSKMAEAVIAQQTPSLVAGSGGGGGSETKVVIVDCGADAPDVVVEVHPDNVDTLLSIVKDAGASSSEPK